MVELPAILVACRHHTTLVFCVLLVGLGAGGAVAIFRDLCYVCFNPGLDCVGREALALHLALMYTEESRYGSSAHVRGPAEFTSATGTSSSTAWARQVPGVLAHSIVCNHHCCKELEKS
jgi:hypothetical protein